VLSSEVLLELGSGKYTLKNLIEFEELLLSTLSWNPNLPTCSNIISELLVYLLDEVQVIEELNHITTLDIQELLSKAQIFAQIAILDYNLSRYGKAIISIISILCAFQHQNQKHSIKLYNLFWDLACSLLSLQGVEMTL